MAQLSTAALRSKALELSAALAKLAEGFNGRAENATKADHLQTYVYNTATRAVTLLYDAADAGVWNEAWPWARGHKPHRYLFQHKLHDFATHLIPDAHLPTDTTGVDLLRPEEIPHQCIKPDRISSALGAISWELGRKYPKSFRTVPSTVDVKLSDGDEADRLEYWQQQAGIFADSCRLLSEMLLHQPKVTSKLRKHRQRKPHAPTAKQLEAVQAFGECDGNYSRAAKRLGLSNSAARQLIEAGYRNTGQTIPARAKVLALRTDRRGQVDVTKDHRKN